MESKDIIDLLPNPSHLMDVARCLRKHRPDDMWCEEEIHARILTVWAANITELFDRLGVETTEQRWCGREIRKSGWKR